MDEVRHSRLWIGTSGWVYPHWREVFYPARLPTTRWLSHYTQHFPTVELNNSFYRLPSERAFRGWREKAPPGFIFAVKANRYITHMKKLKEPEDNVSTLLGRIKMLGDKLGPILFQLPPRWHYNEERLAAFLESLPGGFHYAFEFRDQSWLNKRTYRLLADHNAAFCIYELDGFLSPKEVTADFIYVRLHGPGGPYQGSYDSAVLAEWTKIFVNWSAQGRSVYCYFDNDEKGYAAVNARTLQNMVAGVRQGQR